MVKTKEDLTGKTFGRLTVIRQAEDYINPQGVHVAQWLCQCSCGSNPVVKLGVALKSGKTKSCGCLQKEMTSKAKRNNHIYDLESQEYAIGYTSKGEPFWFDKEDYQLVSRYSGWYYSNGYVIRKDNNGVMFLHRLVMNVTDPNIEVDHIDHPPKPENKIDNRKNNLRLVTPAQNQMNRHVSKSNTSGITGIAWSKERQKWEAYITLDYKKKNLGRFSNKEDAISARKAAEVEYFGEHRYDAHIKKGE
ncbi:MAG: hypothetical protein IJD91_06880 [Clostridia bacterium]|nr:hypothetical protein [Clostridia bacterium]